MAKALQRLNWADFGSSITAGKYIAGHESFVLAIEGKAAGTLRAVMRPGVTVNRELVGKLVGSFTLAMLPGLMMYALQQHYQLDYALGAMEGKTSAEVIEVRFRAPGKPAPATPTQPGKPAPPKEDPA